MKTYLRPVTKAWLGDHWGALAFSVLHAFYYIALVPLVLKLCGRRLNKTVAA